MSCKIEFVKAPNGELSTLYSKLYNHFGNQTESINIWLRSKTFDTKGLELDENGEITFNELITQLLKQDDFTTLSKLHFASKPYENITTEGFTAQEELHLFKVLANKFHQVKDSLLNVTKKEAALDENKRLRRAIYDSLVDDIKAAVNSNKLLDNQTELITRFLSDFKKKDSKLWENFKNYFKRADNYDISDVDEEFDTVIDEIPANWDSSNQFKENRKNNILTNIKTLIATTLKVDPSADITKNKNWDYKSQENVASKATLTGLPESLNFDEVAPYLMSLLAGSTSPKDMLNRLWEAGTYHDKTLLNLYNRIISKGENTLNGLYNSFNLSNPKRVIGFFKSYGDELEFSSGIANNNAYPERHIAQIWQSVIDLNIENGQYSEELANKVNIKEKEAINNPEKAPQIISDIFKTLGLDIHKTSIKYTLDKYEDYTDGIQEEYINTIDRIVNYIKEPKGDSIFNILIQLGNTVKMFTYNISDSSSTNINNDVVYNYQYHSYLSTWFKLLENDNLAFNMLNETYAKVPKMQYSNWLWNDSNDIENPNGLLDFEVDENGIKKATRLNIKFRDAFTYNLFEGNKNLNSLISQEYAHILDKDWLLNKLVFYANGITKKSNSNNITVPLTMVSGDTGHTNYITTKRIPIDNTWDSFFTGKGTGYIKSPLFQALMNTINQEFEEMKQMKELLFKKDNTGEDYLTDENGKFVLRGDIDYNKLQLGKDWDGKEILNKNGYPTGRVFKFQNMYIVQDGKQLYLNDYIPELMQNGIIDDGYIDSNTYERVYDFVREYLSQNFDKLKEKLFPIEDNIKKLNNNKLLKDWKSYEHFLLEFLANDYIYNIESAELWNGSLNEYKNSDDANKRYGQIIKNKFGNISTEGLLDPSQTFTGITIADIEIPSNIKKFLDKVLSKEEADSYSKINIADGQSYITLKEYKNRLKLFGRYKNYEQLINRIEKGETINTSEYRQLIESQKYFLYSRQFDPDKQRMVSKQIKNSVFILVPQFLRKGSELATIADFMDKNNIQQVNFESAEKLGIHKLIKLHDSKGNLINLDANKDDILKGINTYYYADLGIQQDVPSNMLDHENKKGVQISKKIWENVNFEGEYDGETGRELFIEAQRLESANIKDSYDKVKKELLNDKGEVDEQKLAELVIKDLIRRGANTNEILGIKYNPETGFTNMPLYSSIGGKKYMSILTSIFTNNITNQKFPGSHVALVSGAFLGKDNFRTLKADELLNVSKKNLKLFDETWLKRSEKEGFELKAEYYKEGDKKLKVAEVLLPAWSKEFYQNGELMNINDIPKNLREMIGYRIPTEDKHSMITFKVVGFIEGGGSQIVLPHDFVNRSGSDFDIDSLYLMQYHFTRDEQGKIGKIEYREDLGAKNSREARNNRLLDIYKSILLNPIHFKELNKPNDFSSTKASKGIIEREAGIVTNIQKNIYNTLDNLAYREANLAVRELKGHSVSYDGLMSILGTMQSKFRNDLTIEIKYKKSELDVSSLQGRYKYREDGEYVYVVHKNLANNAKMDWLNVNGENISLQTSQVSANILDAVKEPMSINLNSYTLPIYKMFGYLGVAHNYKDEKGNSFLYADAIIHQPIIRELSKEFFDRQGILYTGRHRNRALEDIKRKYQTELYKKIRTDKYKIDWAEKQLKNNDVLFIPPKNKEHFYNFIGKSTQAKKLNYTGEGFTVFSLEELISNLKQKDDIKFLVQQLQVLENWKQFLDMSQAIVDAANIFNTDKLGAGPELSITDNLNIKIDDYLMPSRDLDKLGYDEEIFNYINKQLKAGLYDNLPPLSRIQINGLNAPVAIYPKYFGLKNESVYPILEAYREYSNQASLDLLSKYDIKQQLNFKDYLDTFNKTHNYVNEKVINNIANYTSAFMINDLPFFINDNDDSGETVQVDYKRILGINIEYISELDINKLENYDKFKELSLANKIQLVLKDKGLYKQFIDRFDNQHILEILSIKNDSKTKENKGYDEIKVNNKGSVGNLTLNSFLDMYYSYNPFLSSIAKDLIRYSFKVTGLTFGFDSLGKYIPSQILYKDTGEGGIGYAAHLRNKFNLLNSEDYAFPEEFNTMLHKANFNNQIINPIVSNVYNRDRTINKNFPVWKADEKGIIAVDYDILQNSQYKNNEFVRVRSFEKPKTLILELNQFDKLDDNSKLTSFIYNGKVKYKVGDSFDLWNGGIVRDSKISSGHEFRFFDRSWQFRKIGDKNWLNMTKEKPIKYLTKNYPGGKHQYIPVTLISVEQVENGTKYHVKVDSTKSSKPSLSLQDDKLYKRTMLGTFLDNENQVQGTVYYYPINKTLPFEFGNSIIDKNNYALNEEEYIKEIQAKEYGVPETESDISQPKQLSLNLPKYDILSSKKKYGINFEEYIEPGYIGRTKVNAENADVTLYFSKSENVGKGGEKVTRNFAKNYLLIRIDKNKSIDYNKIIEFLNKNNATSINFAGNRLIKFKATQTRLDQFMLNVVTNIIHHPALKNKITSIRTGGQTGIDEAAAKTSAYLGINTTVTMPKDWLYEDGKGEKSLERFKEIDKNVSFALVHDELNSANEQQEGQKENIVELEKIKKNVAIIQQQIVNARKDKVVFKNNSNIEELNDLYNNIANEELEKGNLEQIANALHIMLEYNVETLKHLQDRLAKYDAREGRYIIEDVVGNRKKEVIFTKDLYFSRMFIDGVLKATELEDWLGEITDDETDVNKQVIKDSIELLNKIQPEITQLKEQAKRQITRYFEAKITPRSSNPEVVKGIRSIFDAIDDESFAQRLLDSVGDSNNVFMANVFKNYVIEMHKSENEQRSRKRRFKKIYDETFGKIPEKDRERVFKEKILERNKNGKYTGKLVSKWSKQWGELYDEQNKPKNQFGTFHQFLTKQLGELIEAFGSSIVNKGYIPAVPLDEGNYWNKLKKRAGFYDVSHHYIVGRDNELVRHIPLNFISKLAKAEVFKIPEQGIDEPIVDFENRVIELAKDAGHNFNSVDEIKEYNKKQIEESYEIHGEKISYDIEDIMNRFIHTAVNYKYKKAIEHEMLLAQHSIAEMEYNKRTPKGYQIYDKYFGGLLGKHVPSFKTDQSNSEKHFSKFMEMVFYDQFESAESIAKYARVLQNVTSAKGMWFNVTGAIKNAAYGNVQIAMETYSNYFWDKKDSKKVDKEYFNNIINMFKSSDSDKATSEVDGLIKYFDILELQSERDIVDGADKIKGNIFKHLMKTDTFYIMHHMGEHYMQNKGLLSMLNSHRLVNGKIISFNDYYVDKREKILKEVISKESYDNYLEYYEQKYEKEKYKDGKKDYIKDFILEYLSDEQQKRFIEKNKLDKNKAKEEFEKFSTLRETYELNKDGYIQVKDGFEVDIEEEALFKNKVKAVNQKIHGIYNKLDSGTIQNVALGRLAMQFRKWARPGWNKRFGSKFGKSYWNEQRNEWDKGSYVSAWEFMTSPVKKSLEGMSEEEKTFFQAARKIINDYGKFVRNVKLHWRLIDDFEKANIKRTLMELMSFIGMVLIGYGLAKIRLDDEEEEDRYAVNLGLYIADATQSELLAYTPIYGWFNESKKILRSPVAGEKTIEDTFKFLNAALFYPFQDDEERSFKGGRYSGKLKLEVYGGRNVPLVNQYIKMHGIKSVVEYYKLFNPF